MYNVCIEIQISTSSKKKKKSSRGMYKKDENLNLPSIYTRNLSINGYVVFNSIDYVSRRKEFCYILDADFYLKKKRRKSRKPCNILYQDTI